MDPASGMRFWYNFVTGVSQWELPEGINEADYSEEPPSWEDAQEGEQEHDIKEVHDLNDLGI